MKGIFWIFASLQALTMGFIVFFILPTSLGMDTKIVLSLLFPLSTVIIEYLLSVR